MNVVLRELATKQNLQDFLIALLNDVQKYFQASGPMSEEKVVTSLNLIFGKVQREFPLISSIDNLSKRIAKDLKVKIADVSTTRQKKKPTHLKSFMEGMEGMEIEEEEMQRVSSEEKQENMNAWIKKSLLKTIEDLREDIKEADAHATETLTTKLARIAAPGSHLPEIIFADSLLTNQTAINALQGYVVKKVVSSPKNPNQISIFQGAKALRKARILILSADAVLRNGGIICTSGGLMLAIAAKELGVPVIAVSRSYCLWQHIICNQQALVVSENGRSWFPEEDELSFRILIGKRFDYVEPHLVTSLVGEFQGWENKNIVSIFEQYYH